MSDAHSRIEEAIRHERNGAPYLALDQLQSVAHSAQDEPEALARSYRHQADVQRSLSRWSEALEVARFSAEIAREAGLTELLAEALNAEALVHHSRGDYLAAEALYEEVLGITREQRMRGVVLQNLGTIAASRGDFEAAERSLGESFLAFQEAAYLRGAAIALNNYARLALDRKDLERARDVCARALETARSVEDQELVALALLNQAELLGRVGEIERAEDLAGAALGYFSLMQNEWRRVECLRLLGDLRMQHGYRDAAVHCYSQALDLAQGMGVLLEASLLMDRLEQAKASA